MNRPLPDADTLYRALLAKDPSYEGIFVVGVRTTGVFCRPTCKARKPRKENVEFFASAREALRNGYRPCKLCRPLAPRGEMPDWLKPIIDDVYDHPDTRLRDADLKARGIDPNRVRRWFKEHHGMTFHAYLRTLRIGRAFGRIKQGDKVIEAAFESGYDSLSGFADTFKKTTGFAPSRSGRRNLIAATRILTPLGPMLAGAVDEGVCLLEFVDRRMIETQIARLKKLLRAEMLPGSHPHFTTLSRQLEEYFAGARREFDLPLVLKGTPFQEEVWKGLLEIPYGTTRSYREQAGLLGRHRAVRAVARANGENRIAIVVPCHRVVGSDGKLRGYGGGLWRKRYLLEHETGSGAR